ncbi:MAG TPA: hypothetical protein VMD47_05620 [Candidatus Acidoferrales bacterium]|nr:hypothetical protein [Candidatus Acidoferrales bacterium]
MIELIRARDYRESEIAVALSDDEPQRVLWRVALEHGELQVTSLEDEFAHDVEIITSTVRFVLDDDEIAFVYALEGEARAGDMFASSGDTLCVHADGGVSVETTGRAAVVRITPV